MTTPLSTRQAAARLGCCERTVLRRIREGKIVASKVALGWRIDPADLERFRTTTLVAVNEEEGW